MNKRFCVLQVAPEQPNQDHLQYFNNKEHCDFYFVTHDKDNKNALKFCPNTIWSETRNALADLVPKKYDYYAFIDYDYILKTKANLDPYQQILEDLEWNPAVLTYYPGDGLETPYAKNMEYFNSRDKSCIPFTHAGLKIVHKSLMNWFFPLYIQKRVDIDACHMFNILEIPFLKNVICSHKMTYDNGHANKDSVYNKNSSVAKQKMDEMWVWISPAFKKQYVLERFITNDFQRSDSLFIKQVFVNLFHDKVFPEKQDKEVNYLNLDKISNFFDLNHEFFSNKGEIYGR